MIRIVFFLFLLILVSCNKPKTVMICGDHECINRVEAKQFFEENLTLEVKIIDNKKSKVVDLVELNLGSDISGKKKINIFNKKETNQKIKKLTKKEIIRKKAQIKEKSRQTKIAKINKKTSNDINKKKAIKLLNIKENTVDICTVLKECNIDEISKYLIKKGAKKDFPDITLKE